MKYIAKCKGCLTQRAINIVNGEFRNGNPYSRSREEWNEYQNKVMLLVFRLKREQER